MGKIEQLEKNMKKAKEEHQHHRERDDLLHNDLLKFHAQYATKTLEDLEFEKQKQEAVEMVTAEQEQKWQSDCLLHKQVANRATLEQEVATLCASEAGLQASLRAKVEECDQLTQQEKQRVEQEGKRQKSWKELKPRLEKVFLNYYLDSVGGFEGGKLQRLHAEFDVNGQGRQRFGSSAQRITRWLS
ncbi:hypothetical protein R1flu_018113 [Riccia fluitans]|uniref:Uncharacterized protein n=1 Tax=Riccia fluitans TaxID=41844 RepID=A0ABD1ZG76_9MARC